MSDVPDSSIYTAVSVLADDEDTDNDVSEAYVLPDMPVSDVVYTGVGFGNSFDKFHTTPEEEIIFESQDAGVLLSQLLHIMHFRPVCTFNVRGLLSVGLLP